MVAGTWHIIALQEAIEYVDHDLLTNRFHVTHYAGCAVLFNKDTFLPDVKVKSIYLHDNSANCYHVPPFDDNLSAPKKHTRSCLYTFFGAYAKKNVA